MKYELVQENAETGYILDKENGEIISLCMNKCPDLGFEKLVNLIYEANVSDIYRKYWLELCDQIINEVDKDGWCRLVMTRDDAFRMKSMFSGGE